MTAVMPTPTRRAILALPNWSPDAPAPVLDAAGDVVAMLAPLVVTDPAFPAFLESCESVTLIAWSGPTEDHEGDPFAPDPRAWLPASMPAFLERLRALEPVLAARRIRLLIRPHARHIVSDGPRCAALFRQEWRAAAPHVGLALDPAAMLEPSMLPVGADHIRRSLELAGPFASVVILTNAGAPTDAEAPVSQVSIREGVVPADELVHLARTHVPEGCPIAVLADDAALLGYTGG